MLCALCGGSGAPQQAPGLGATNLPAVLSPGGLGDHRGHPRGGTTGLTWLQVTCELSAVGSGTYLAVPLMHLGSPCLSSSCVPECLGLCSPELPSTEQGLGLSCLPLARCCHGCPHGTLLALWQRRGLDSLPASTLLLGGGVLRISPKASLPGMPGFPQASRAVASLPCPSVPRAPGRVVGLGAYRCWFHLPRTAVLSFRARAWARSLASTCPASRTSLV